jgi:exopolysaccharide production protein ExoZ
MRDYFKAHFESARGGSSHNLQPMEGLRGLAVGLVFWVHYVALATPWVHQAGLLEILVPLKAMGSAGVDLFFVLSGYLIYGALISRPQNFWTFMQRRIRRIYPAFAVVFVLYLVLSFVFPAESKIPKPLLSGAIYLVENFLLLPGMLPITPLITVAWSLSYEMFYYLVLPVVVGVAGLRARSGRFRVWFFGAVALALLLCAAAGYGRHLRLVMFIAGILLYEASKGSCVPCFGGGSGLFALLIGLGATAFSTSNALWFAAQYGLLFTAFFVLCRVCFEESSTRISRAFCWTPLRWLGNMSYSYYLIHGLGLKVFFLVLSRVWPHSSQGGSILFWSLLPVAFAVTLLPSALLFLSVEHPLSLTPPKRTVAS